MTRVVLDASMRTKLSDLTRPLEFRPCAAGPFYSDCGPVALRGAGTANQPRRIGTAQTIERQDV